MPQWITNFTYKIECHAAQAGVVYRLASQYYRDVIQKEIVLANITDKDHILCVGGGICPFSGILFHQITGARVTVIDNNEACIPKARQVINRLDIGDYVRVVCKDGGDGEMDLLGYSVIHLALQVTPIDHVFSQIKERAAAGTRLLVRRPKRLLDDIYSKLPNPQLVCGPYVIHKSRNIGSTLMHIKQERPYEEKVDIDGIDSFTSVNCPVSA